MSVFYDDKENDKKIKNIVSKEKTNLKLLLFTFYAIISKVAKINGYGIVIMFVSVNKEEGEDSYG